MENGYAAYPAIRTEAIEDKNKADLFARGATLLQITWFTVQSIARGVQRLGITTLELSTIAFIFCTLHSCWFWRKKPLDIEEPIILPCEKPLAEIVRESGLHVGRYRCTPFDALNQVSRLSYVEPFFYGVKLVFMLDRQAPRELPSLSFPNTGTIPPRGLLWCDCVFAVTASVIYVGIHLAAWDFPFPTPIEQLLWRVAALSIAGTIMIYVLACWPGNYLGARMLGRADAKYALQQAKLLPRWVANCLHVPVLIIYMLCRSYIIVEGFANLRRLPPTEYASVKWWGFLPHL